MKPSKKSNTKRVSKERGSLTPLRFKGPVISYPNDKTYYGGYDYYITDPQTCKSHKCGACGSDMDICRTHSGHRSMVSAMGGIKSTYDVFTCHFSGLSWHDALILLKEERNQTSSPRLQEIIKLDIEDILSIHHKEITSYKAQETNEYIKV